MKHSEKRVRARLHSEKTQEAGSRFCSHREADVSLRLGKATGSPRVCREQVWQRFDKRAAGALMIQAAEPAQTQVEPNRLAADRKIGWRPSVVAVDPIRTGAACRTGDLRGAPSRVNMKPLAGSFNPVRETTSKGKWSKKISHLRKN
jgi:hypothetical protein